MGQILSILLEILSILWEICYLIGIFRNHSSTTSSESFSGNFFLQLGHNPKKLGKFLSAPLIFSFPYAHANRRPRCYLPDERPPLKMSKILLVVWGSCIPINPQLHKEKMFVWLHSILSFVFLWIFPLKRLLSCSQIFIIHSNQMSKTSHSFLHYLLQRFFYFLHRVIFLVSVVTFPSLALIRFHNIKHNRAGSLSYQSEKIMLIIRIVHTQKSRIL
jgi:hypothetical protein